MRQIFLLAVLLPFCYSIDIHFESNYGNAIKKISIPSCREEPCALIKGQHLNVSITFESTYPKQIEYKDAKEVSLRIYLDGYRNRYNLNLAQLDFCKSQPNECPLVLHKNYTMNAYPLLLPDIPGQPAGAFGQRNGKNFVLFELIMTASNGGTVIAGVGALMDIHAAH